MRKRQTSFTPAALQESPWGAPVRGMPVCGHIPGHDGHSYIISDHTHTHGRPVNNATLPQTHALADIKDQTVRRFRNVKVLALPGE